MQKVLLTMLFVTNAHPGKLATLPVPTIATYVKIVTLIHFQILEQRTVYNAKQDELPLKKEVLLVARVVLVNTLFLQQRIKMITRVKSVQLVKLHWQKLPPVIFAVLGTTNN